MLPWLKNYATAMALNKKKSRLITIEPNQYRWVVSPNSGFNVFVAEKENIKGRKIEVYFDMYINKFKSRFVPMAKEELKIIKPKDAESIIRQAIIKGWNPDERGRPVVFDLEGEKIIERKSTKKK
jgi:hypothetical protein